MASIFYFFSLRVGYSLIITFNLPNIALHIALKHEFPLFLYCIFTIYVRVQQPYRKEKRLNQKKNEEKRITVKTCHRHNIVVTGQRKKVKPTLNWYPHSTYLL